MRSKLAPLSHYREPGYPTWSLVEQDPTLLIRAVPGRWARDHRLTAALFAAALGLPGIGSAGTSDPVVQAAGNAIVKREPNVARPVAVVFSYGEGRGSTGCVSVVPPAFLSEEEARGVIQQELAGAGLHLAIDDEIVQRAAQPRAYYLAPEAHIQPDVGAAESNRGARTVFLVPRTSPQSFCVDDDGQDGALTLDGFDETWRVGYEYVSRDDYRHVGGLNEMEYKEYPQPDGCRFGVRSSVSHFDFRNAAEILADRLARYGGDRVLAVFYDPMEQIDATAWMATLRSSDLGRSDTGTSQLTRGEGQRDAMQAEAQARARELLRQQVRDFAIWLQEQGILR